MTSPAHGQRLVTSRLVHRFNFGPKPGQFSEFLERGVAATQEAVLRRGADPGADAITPPSLPVLGPFPDDSSTPAGVAFWNTIYAGQTATVSWWLDRMYASDLPLTERMTWFWHGHWATALSKIYYPLAMYKQNVTLRKYALDSFHDMARAMVVDGAFNYWLDNEENYLTSPNENMARELMELMTLGVNEFSQNDVVAAAHALTGYSTNLPTGAVGFDASQHYNHPVSILGTRNTYNADSLADLLVSREQNARYITDRLWFRFVSGTTKPPASLAGAFSGRDINSLVHALVYTSAWADPANALVKSPVEWFVGACRALRVRPSSLNVGNTQWSLNQMGQIPFNPPNVGGWPYGQAWLSGVAFQYRFDLAQSIVAAGDLSPLSVPKSHMVQACADWLGVPAWSPRTASTLNSATGSASEFVTAALLSPEYVVST
ncbi:MAG: DUF1800 family protein [Acidimicrobiales bacterium]